MSKNSYKNKEPPKERERKIKNALLLMAKNPNAPALQKLISTFDCEAGDLAHCDNTGEYYDAKELVSIIESGKKENQQKMAKESFENNKNYNTIINGKFAVYKPEKTEKSVTIESKKTGVKREYELFKSISGKITKIYVYEKTLNDVDVEFLVIYVSDKSENDKEVIEVIEIPFKQRYAKDILFKLPNIDETQIVKLTPYRIKDTEKSKTSGSAVYNEGVTIEQFGEKVKRFYTKDEPNGLPEAVETKIKGKKSEWSFALQEEFLRERVKELNSILSSESPATVNENDSQEEESDDLPF